MTRIAPPLSSLRILPLAVLLAACGDNLPPPGSPADAAPEPPPDAVPPDAAPPGVVDPGWFRGRQLDYLRFATQEFTPAQPLNVIAHMERDRVDPDYDTGDLSVPAGAWDPIFERMAGLKDGRDFDALYVLHVLSSYREHPMLAPGLADAVERALLDFKYWYTEPTPEGVEDDSYYWSENHAVMYHAVEYLMGQAYPDTVFTSDGKTGAEHRAHAEAKLLRWLDLRARLGFSEWHSNVYYQKDITPLLALVEYADDQDMRTRAAGVLDILLFDMALHTQRAAFGVTHGRSYKKDKMTSWDEDTWNVTKMLFDTTGDPYFGTGEPGGVLFARAQGYAYPEAIRRVARTQQVFVDRERMGIDVRFGLPYEPAPEALYGLDYTDPDDLAIWWSAGAIVAWPVLPLTFATMDAYDLWDHPEFALIAGFQPLAADPVMAQQLAAASGVMINLPLMGEVDTYTWRSPEVMLSSAVGYDRAGGAAYQAHAWQATFDANAIVFTNHPFRDRAMSTDWRDDPETGGYWNGEASMPLSLQHENVAIHIYAPQYPSGNHPVFGDAFTYQPFTHAYLPREHFDEVVQDENWTFARRGDGYLALYSYRAPEYREYDPAMHATGPLTDDFDLVAEGGADNVWIVEVGRAADWDSFAAFRQAVSAAALEVTARPAQNGLPGGFDVSYTSPSQGAITFDWDGAAQIDGEDVTIGGHPRFDNPFSQTAFDSRELRIEIEGQGVELDFAAPSRRLYAAE